MARAKIVIGTVNEGTPQEGFQIRVRQGMARGEILALLDLAAHKARAQGVSGFLEDRAVVGAAGEAAPRVAIGTVDEGTADEDIAVRVRRGTSLVALVGLLKMAEFQVNAGGVHGYLGGIEVAAADALKRVGVGPHDLRM